jgi:hypothetical protein
MGPEAVAPIQNDADTFLEQPGDQRRAVLDLERFLDRLPQPLDDRDAALLPHRPHTVIAADLIQISLEALVNCPPRDLSLPLELIAGEEIEL